MKFSSNHSLMNITRNEQIYTIFQSCKSCMPEDEPNQSIKWINSLRSLFILQELIYILFNNSLLPCRASNKNLWNGHSINAKCLTIKGLYCTGFLLFEKLCSSLSYSFGLTVFYFVFRILLLKSISFTMWDASS